MDTDGTYHFVQYTEVSLSQRLLQYRACFNWGCGSVLYIIDVPNSGVSFIVDVPNSGVSFIIDVPNSGVSFIRGSTVIQSQYRYGCIVHMKQIVGIHIDLRVCRCLRVLT